MIVNGRRKVKVNTPATKSNSEDEYAVRYERLRSLSLKINSLPGNMIRDIIGIVVAREPAFHAVGPDPDEIDIDFEQLMPSTITELEAFVSAYMESNPGIFHSPYNLRPRRACCVQQAATASTERLEHNTLTTRSGRKVQRRIE